MSAIETTPFIRGCIDALSIERRQQAHVRGWIFRPDIAAVTVDISLNGAPWVSGIHLFDRPEVQTHFDSTLGAVPGLPRCGFDATAPLPAEDVPRNGDVVGIALYADNARYLGTWQNYHSRYPDREPILPEPPEQLKIRVGGSQDFDSIGMQAASLIAGCVAKHKSLSSVRAALDWGCGCARIMKQMMKFIPTDRLFGCDIDSEAIKWCERNIAGPSFTRIDPYPPTPYADDSFDLIYGISVMTHLDEPTQLLWLAELSRITRPNGILALSIIGDNLRRSNMPISLSVEFEERGFATFVPAYSTLLAQFANEQYYKETFHSIEYVAAAWGHFFDVLECVETKHQDIIILRATNGCHGEELPVGAPSF